MRQATVSLKQFCFSRFRLTYSRNIMHAFIAKRSTCRESVETSFFKLGNPNLIFAERHRDPIIISSCMAMRWQHDMGRLGSIGEGDGGGGALQGLCKACLRGRVALSQIRATRPQRHYDACRQRRRRRQGRKREELCHGPMSNCFLERRSGLVRRREEREGGREGSGRRRFYCFHVI